MASTPTTARGRSCRRLIISLPLARQVQSTPSLCFAAPLMNPVGGHRSPNSPRHEPNLGDQNAHALHLLQAPRRLHFRPRRHAPDLPLRWPRGLLPRSRPFPLRRLPRRAAIHGLRAAEAIPWYKRVRRSYWRPEEGFEQYGLLVVERAGQDLRGRSDLPVPSRQSEAADLRGGTDVQERTGRGAAGVEARRGRRILQGAGAEYSQGPAEHLCDLFGLREHEVLPAESGGGK